MKITGWTTLAAALLFAACSGGKEGAEGGEGKPEDGAKVEQEGGEKAATGKVIVVEMITDESGSYFKPKDIEAHPGDILRFTLTAGVHNVHFVADSNPGIPNLPPASELLQLPGQTVDITVPSAKDKKLYFQCDPHAALGMIGHVEIEGDD